MNDKDLRDLKHFTTPFRIGNIIIAGMALCFVPMLLGIIFLAITRLFEALVGSEVNPTLLALLIAAAIALAACTQTVKPPTNEERKAIQKAQTDIWNGTTEAKKRRIP